MYKLSLYCFFLTSANLILHETIFSLLLSFPQIVFIIYLVVSQKGYDRVVFYHMLFLFTTLAIPYSQLTNPGEASAVLLNYSRLKLVGPIAVSQCLLLMILLYGLVKSHNMRVFKQQKPILCLILYFFITGSILSSIGLAFNDYSTSKMLTYFVYISVLLLTAVMLCMVDNTDNIRKLVYSLLVTAPIAAVVVYFLGFSAEYGNSKIPGMTEVAYFSPILIYKFFTEKKSSFIEFISIVCSLYLVFTGAPGGKGIIVIAFIILLTFISKVSIKTFIYICLLSIVTILATTFLSYEEIHAYNGLLLYKLESVYMLLTFVFDFDMRLVNLLPMSPRVRVIEFYLILQEQSENLVYLMFGQGYGGWYKDAYGYFSGVDLKSAFSPEEIQQNKFHSSHDFFTTLPFFHGLFGVIFMGYVFFYYLKKVKNDYLFISIVPFLMSIYFNNQFGAFAIVVLLIASTRYRISVKANN